MERVSVDASTISDGDATAAEMLAELEDELAGRDIALAFTGIRPSVRDLLAKAGVRAVAGRGADEPGADPSHRSEPLEGVDPGRPRAAADGIRCEGIRRCRRGVGLD